MTMQVTHSPKPKIFGKGYGKHVANNLKLMKQFFWLGWKMLANTFVPGVFYERAHWEVIDLYHSMRGFRHGTSNDHRCAECGSDFLSADDVAIERDELKKLEMQLRLIEECDRAMDKYRADSYQPMTEKEKEEILVLMDAITPAEVEAYKKELEQSSDK